MKASERTQGGAKPFVVKIRGVVKLLNFLVVFRD
jgi:hypothetical protein